MTPDVKSAMTAKSNKLVDDENDDVVENLSSKTLMLFKDDSEICKRAVSEISWYPESVL